MNPSASPGPPRPLSEANANTVSTPHHPGSAKPSRLHTANQGADFPAGRSVTPRKVLASPATYLQRFATHVKRHLLRPSGLRASFVISQHLFIRLLAGIYITAFASFWSQAGGLVGSNGILPADQLLRHLQTKETFGFLDWPSLFVLFPTDTGLNVLCAAGTVIGAILMLTGFLPMLLLTLLWVLYLSLVLVGQVFMNFQWDVLLLETGFLAILYASSLLRPGFAGRFPPSTVVRLLLYWLLFRLMFRSGLVKLASNDDVWWDLSALNYHYWTQPIPTWTAWYMHQLPDLFHKISVSLTYAIELALPFAIFLPRRFRLTACTGFTFLMLMIIGTGNYTYFNYLAIVLCIPLIDDSVFPAFLQKRVRPISPPPRRWLIWNIPRHAAILAAAACILAMTVPYTFQTLQQANYVRAARALEKADASADAFEKLPRPGPVPELSRRLNETLAPFRLVGHYGLFADMTESRPEIIIEASLDGVAWHPYEFKYKPGTATRRPPFVAPHQPRLDWQMWFAALQRPESVYWFPPFLRGLLEARPEILALLESSPFGSDPPRYVRARRTEYRFSDSETRKKTGAWWICTDRGLYLPYPAIGLENFKTSRQADRHPRH